MSFDIIIADPPWDYKGQVQHNGKGGKETGSAELHYSTMTLDQLAKIPVSTVASDNSLLFLWTSSPHLDQAISLMESWGFSYTTIAFVWNKDKVNPGFYTMSQVEIVLVGKKGKIPAPRGSRKERQMVNSPREEHSKKPDEVQSRIEKMFPTQTKLELFARRVKGGWTCIGNEISGNDISIDLASL